MFLSIDEGSDSLGGLPEATCQSVYARQSVLTASFGSTVFTQLHTNRSVTVTMLLFPSLPSGYWPFSDSATRRERDSGNNDHSDLAFQSVLNSHKELPA